MKKWSIAKRKMAWQMTGDRNIGGHTARIPDSYHFLSGPGPRGVGIDLSSKDKIETLAETIIPQTTISKKGQLCMKLEERWLHHHGGGKKGTSARRGRSLRSSRSSQALDPVRSLFNKTTLKPDAIQELIAQLRAAAASSGTNSLEQIEEDPKPPGKRHMDSRVDKEEDDTSSGESSDKEDSSSETLEEIDETPSPTKLPDNAARPGRQSVGAKPPQKPELQKSPPKKSTQSHRANMILKSKILSKRKPSDAKKTVKSSAASTKPKKVTMKSSNDKKSPERKNDSSSTPGQIKSPGGAENGTKEGKGRGGSLWGALGPAVRHAKSRQSTTPDSGFQSDSPSFTNIMPDVKSQGSNSSNTKVGNAMTELLKSARMMQMMKKPKAGEDSSESGGNMPEQALISLLEKVGKEEESQQGLYKYNPKMKKAYQASTVISTLTGNRFIMPLTQNYEIDVPKDGQSFTRRRTRGLMYETLEPIVYSNVYVRKSPNLQTPSSKLGRNVAVGAGFH